MSNSSDRRLESRTKQFALSIIHLYAQLPKSTVAQVLGRKVLRSGTSVGAQDREAMRAKSIADFISKIEGSLQEIEETRYWLDLLVESRTVSQSSVEDVRSEAGQPVAMLVASVRTAKKQTPKVVAQAILHLSLCAYH